ITQITSKTVDFGASDAPLKDSEAAGAPGLLEIPTVLGAVVLAYNAPGVPTGLKLTPEAISGIFLGKVKFWDDAAIKSDNSGVTELAYAASNTTTYASVEAPSGDFGAPSIDSVTAAGAGLTFPIGPKTNVLQSTAAGAYPMSTTTYLLVYKDQTDKDKAQTLVDLIYWI